MTRVMPYKVVLFLGFGGGAAVRMRDQLYISAYSKIVSLPLCLCEVAVALCMSHDVSPMKLPRRVIQMAKPVP